MARGFRFPIAVAVLTLAAAAGAVGARQLSPRPTEDWIARLERPERVSGLKIEYILSKLDLKPGQTVADIGAGPGVISLPMAKMVAPGGKIYAVDIDQPFLDHIAMRAKEAHVTNVMPILGKFTDPSLPAKDVDVALFHDVLHHIENRAAYLKSMTTYMKPTGRIAIVELSPTKGSHKDEPALQVSKDQAKAWLAVAGFKPVQEFDGLPEDKWFVVYARQ
jgi:ubiquinone/menaquinone biosynthesis C-methylase UbiE